MQPKRIGRLYVEPAGGTPAGGGGGGTPPSDPPKDPSEKTLTEAQFNERMKARVEEAKRSASEQVAKDLGVTVEEAKKIIADARERDDKAKSDAEKATEAANKAKADADVKVAESTKAAHAARVERALLRIVPRDLDGDALDKRLARLAGMLGVVEGADDDAIGKAIGDLKAEWPELFVASDGKTPPPPGDPKGKPPPGKPNEDAWKRGAERAKTHAGVGRQYAILETHKT